MKILYLHQYFNTPQMSGGTRSYEMARRLVQKGHEVHMITSDRRPNSDQKCWYETEEAGIHVHWYPVRYTNQMSYQDRIKAFFAFSWASAKRAVKIGGDIVFATSTPLTIALPGVYASKRLKIPMVFEVRDLWPEMPIAVGALKHPFLIWAARRLEKFAYNNSSHVVALSPGMKDGVVAAGYPEEKVTVIPNSCDIEMFNVSPEVGKQLRKEIPWLGDRPLVVYIGTFGIINGVSYLVDVAKHALEINPEICFAAIGDGKEKEKVREYAREQGVLGKNLFLLDPVPKSEVPRWLSACDIATSLFVDIPEMWNNSANKFFDALAAGKPIAINYLGWQSDVIINSDCGLALPKNDGEKSARDICECLKDPNRMNRYSQNALETGKRLFERNDLANKLTLLFESLDSAK